ncbi:MAG: hypothetical protein ABIH92_01030 [Nanoarchaeota archaeon]
MPKYKHISIRVTDEEKKKIEADAAKHKLNVSKFFVMLYYRFGDQL